MVGILAEVTLSLAERYDMELACLGGDRGYIHLMCSADPKIFPWQMVRMFKSIRDQAMFRGELAFKKFVWREVLVLWLLEVVSGGKNWRVVQQYQQEQGRPREDLRQLNPF